MDPLKVLWVLTNSTYLVSKYMKNSDKDDSSPFFEQAVYEAQVEESAKPHYTVVRVTVEGHEKFSDVKYEITSGNVGSVFGVESKSGDIYVEDSLDYETRQKYELIYSATARRTTTFTTVIVHVTDVNDNPPVFDKAVYTVDITEEDGRGLPRKILEVAAVDGDTYQPTDIIYFLAGQGIDSDDPATGNFAIDKGSGEIFVLKPLDRDPPLGRPQWRFTVFAQDEGGKGLVGFADVQVNLKDINDNAPHFSHTEYIGNVTENSPKGALVIALDAEDNDDPFENGNAKIKYSIEKNAIEEGTGLPIFEIQPNTGEIKTLICCLDREKTSDYAIQVIATDGAGLKGTGTVTIRVLDINDSVPVFTKDEWVTEVAETVGDVTPNTPVLTVAVRDDDENNHFVYSVIQAATVVDKSGYGAEKFAMIANVDGTGSLVVTQPLDYEDPLQRNGFRFQIQVVDEDDHSPPGSSHTAYSWVVVKLLDVNDNAPQFDNPHPTVTVYEDIPTGSVLDQLRAKDADNGGRSRIRFAIDRSSDRNRQFHVSQDGKLSVHRKLDRETNAIHHIKVLAVDDGYPPQTGSVTVTVLVNDVNDNAPRFVEDYRPVVQENEKPQEILKVYAVDPDDSIKGNGLPFTFVLDPNANETIKKSFRVVQEKGSEDAARVISLVSFDREQRKEYPVPIVIADSGQPLRSSTNTLTVIVGDTNDNPMYPGGMEVLAYVYRVQNMDIPIGRVFVEDLDDWDLPDKEFRWETREHHRFKLNKDTGELTMRSGTHRGLYNLYFRVQDRRHNQNNVKAHVRVRVRDLSYNSVTNSGSLRLSGISAVELVRKRSGGSKLSLLQTKLAEVLKVEEEHVAIFSVQQVLAHPPLTDVRFAVTNFKREVVDGLLMLHTNLVEEAVKLNITSVGVDECSDERRCEGSCTARLEVGGSNLVNANTTVLVGVRVVAVAECLCGALDYARPESCRSRPCYNGGRCIEGRYGISCSCPSGFKGPRCQRTSRSFNGEGWAWYPPLSVCDNNHLSFEFLARKADGQLVYNGPVGPPKPGGMANSDLISLELVDGYPRLLMDYGSGTVELNLTTETRLNDSSWHRLDVQWNTETVELVVDQCLGAMGLKDAPSCSVRGAMAPFSELLNPAAPLQLGGRRAADFSPRLYRWNHVPYGISFDGCIKNLMCNSKLYDLESTGLSVGSAPGCPGSCPTECVHGDCVGGPREPRCSCDPGYQGAQCIEPTHPITLEPHSYVKYSLNFEPDLHVTRVDLRFRTREESGELFRLGDQRADQYAVLEITESRLRFRYKLSDSAKAELRITAIKINDGQWHHVKVSRVGGSVSLELDGGEGRRGNRTWTLDSRQQLVVDAEEGVYLGGRPEYTEIGIIAVEHDYQEGCIDDVRLNSRPLSLPPFANSTVWAAALVTQNTALGCPTDKLGCIDDVRLNSRPLPLPPVANSTVWAAALVAQNTALGCPTDKLCSTALCRGAANCPHADPWNTHRCFCGEGKVLTADGKLCVASNDCWVKPCLNGGVCQEVDNRQQYRCVCPDDYWGDQCELASNKHTLRLGMGALATVLGCLLVILLVVLLMLVIYNRRRLQGDKKDIECDVRENIIKYNDEGGGADDMTAMTLTISGAGDMSCLTLAEDTVSETSFIDLTRRRKPTDCEEELSVLFSPSRDEVHIYTFEGGGSSRASLSSLSIGE